VTRIDCDDFRKFIDPYLDGEFDAGESAAFDAHLAVCAECRGHYEQKAWFINALRPCLRRPEPMPAAVHDRLSAKLRVAQRPERRRRLVRRLAPVPALAAVGAVLLFVTPLTGFAPAMVDDAVDQHCRTVPVEVPTPEAAQADEWFSGKVPFSMATPRFEDPRAMLLGGRLSQVRSNGRSRRAAYLVYGVGEHKLSVLVFDGSELKLGEYGDLRKVKGNAVRVHDSRGYRVALYRRGNLAYAVTSDLPETEMLRLIGSSL
jgi:anti-sigma factor RsiW